MPVSISIVPPVRAMQFDAGGAAADVTLPRRHAAPAAGGRRAVPVALAPQFLEHVDHALLSRIGDAKRDRIGPDRVRDHIEVRFDREQDLRFARRAHMTARHGVRVNAHHFPARIRNMIRQRRNCVHGGQHRRNRFSRAERAAVEDHAADHRGDRPSGSDGGLQENRRRMPDVGRTHVVEIRAHRFDRALGRTGEKVTRELVDRKTFGAEIAADIGRLDHDRFLWNARGDRHLLS